MLTVFYQFDHKSTSNVRFLKENHGIIITISPSFGLYKSKFNFAYTKTIKLI
jgi:hypothetical protein